MFQNRDIGHPSRRSVAAEGDGPSKIFEGAYPFYYFCAGFWTNSSSWPLFHSARSLACSFCKRWIAWMKVCIVSSSVRPGAKVQLLNMSVSGSVSIWGAIHVNSNPFTSFTWKV